MTLNVLPGVPLAGTLSLTFVPVTSGEGSFDINAPSVDLATDSTAIVAQCLIPSGTYTGVTTEANQIRKGRACTTVPYYVAGEESVNVERVQVVYDPQDMAKPISKAYAALVPGTQWYMIDRRGKSGQTALEAGDIVDIYKVEVIARNKPYSDDEGAEAVADILFTFLGEKVEDKALVDDES